MRKESRHIIHSNPNSFFQFYLNHAALDSNKINNPAIEFGSRKFRQ